jgi:hypothetical protein
VISSLAGTERSPEHSGREGPSLRISEASGPAEKEDLERLHEMQPPNRESSAEAI